MQAERTQSEAQMRANVEEFARMFPDVREIPEEVIAEIERTGETPVVAYQNYLLGQKEKELAALRQAEKTSGPGLQENSSTLPNGYTIRQTVEKHWCGMIVF